MTRCAAILAASVLVGACANVDPAPPASPARKVPQQRTAQLQQLAATHAIGGKCDAIALDSTERFAVTRGEFGDLAWWNLRERKQLARAPKGFAKNPFANSERGNLACNYPERDGTSKNGEHHVALKSARLIRDGAQLDFPSVDDTWFDLARICDDGTVIASDGQGQVHIQGADEDDRRLFAPHRGHATDLVFSPDGQHLAICGLGAVRIVDRNGEQELELAGTHIVRRGPAGPEFLVCGRHDLRRFHASARRYVGETVSWERPGIRLLTPAPAPLLWIEGGFASRCYWRPCALWTNGTRLVAFDNARRENLWQLTPGVHADAVRFEEHAPQHVLELPDGRLLVFSVRDHPTHFDLEVTHAYLLDDTMAELAHWQVHGTTDWTVMDVGRDVAWIGHGKQLFGVRLSSLEQLPGHKVDATMFAACLWRDGNLLVATDKSIRVVAADTAATLRSWPLPRGLQEIDVIACSPDHRHIAVADDHDVRILRVVD